MKIIPSILTGDRKEAKELLTCCEGVVDRVSIDIIDGKFADNKTITPDFLADFKTTLKVDYQLIVVEPVSWIERCVRGRANTIIGHIEHMDSQEEFVEKVKKSKVEVGLGIDLETPVSEIKQNVLSNLDTVLLMSVPAGFGGQEFSYQVIEKIKSLSNIRKENKATFTIHVDGGVNFDNIKDIADAGADEVSVGRLLFKGDLRENVEKFNELLKYQ